MNTTLVQTLVSTLFIDGLAQISFDFNLSVIDATGLSELGDPVYILMSISCRRHWAPHRFNNRCLTTTFPMRLYHRHANKASWEICGLTNCAGVIHVCFSLRWLCVRVSGALPDRRHHRRLQPRSASPLPAVCHVARPPPHPPPRLLIAPPPLLLPPVGPISVFPSLCGKTTDLRQETRPARCPWPLTFTWTSLSSSANQRRQRSLVGGVPVTLRSPVLRQMETPLTPMLNWFFSTSDTSCSSVQTSSFCLVRSRYC